MIQPLSNRFKTARSLLVSCDVMAPGSESAINIYTYVKHKVQESRHFKTLESDFHCMHAVRLQCCGCFKVRADLSSMKIVIAEDLLR